MVTVEYSLLNVILYSKLMHVNHIIIFYNKKKHADQLFTIHS